MDLNKYKNLISRRCSTKYSKDTKILPLSGVVEKVTEDAKNSTERSDRSNKDPNLNTGGDTEYINDI